MINIEGRSSVKKKSEKHCRFLSILTILVVIATTTSYLTTKFILTKQINKNTILRENSKALEYWKDPPAEVIRNYYFFSIDNSDQVGKGERPSFTEYGPYAFREKAEKRNVEFIGPDEIRFNPVITLYFEPSMSVGKLSDHITTLNIPALGMIEDALHGNTDKSSVNLLTSMMSTRLFITRTVEQLISGYEDDLLDMAQYMMPDKIKSNIFSYTKGSNGTIKDQFSIRTGHFDSKNKGKIVTYNGKEALDIWPSDEANSIRGTDGTVFAPYILESEKLWFFNSDACRSLYLEYKQDVEQYDMNLKSFHLPKNIFYNSLLNPLNAGFTTKAEFIGNGVQSISRCNGGMSSFLSKPHFLNAEKKFVSNIIGLNPVESKHDTSLNFEQTTGVPISGNIRLQINFYLSNDPDIDLLKNVQANLLPVMWFDESIKLDKEIREQLSLVQKIIKISDKINIILFFSGITLFLLTVTLAAYNCFKNKIKYSVIKSSPVISTVKP